MRDKQKTKILLIAAALLLLLSLCGCSEASPSSANPEPTPSATPAPTPMPMPEPTPPLPQGETVTVDGTELSESVMSGALLYVPADEFFAALGLEFSESGGIISVEWRGDTVTLGGEESALIEYRQRTYLPVTAVCERMGISLLHDGKLKHLYCTPAAGDWVLPEGYSVPILMYHYVTDDIGSSWAQAELFVSPEKMEEQLKYIVDNGYQPIWFEDLEHIDEYEKPVILTFDDGRLDNYYNLYPLLQKYNVKATFFVVSDYMLYQPTVCMYPSLLRELSDSGLVSVQSHTKTHPFLNNTGRERQEREFEQSKLDIARATGKEPFVLCYPGGHYNNITLEIIGDYYRFGVMMSGKTYVTGDDPLLVYRKYVPRGITLDAFARMLEG